MIPREKPSTPRKKLSIPRKKSSIPRKKSPIPRKKPSILRKNLYIPEENLFCEGLFVEWSVNLTGFGAYDILTVRFLGDQRGI